MYREVNTPRFVAMFDILGFKALRAKLGTDALHSLFKQSIATTIIHAAAGASQFVERGGKEFLEPKENIISVAYVVFSDTVLFWSADDSYTAFLGMINSSKKLLAAGFGTSIPFRGAIGFGDGIMGPDVYVGSAIEDAYAGEQAQTWSGCMMTQTCKAYIEEKRYLETLLADFPEAIKAAPEETRDRVRAICSPPPLYDVPINSNPRNKAGTYSTLSTYAIDWTTNVSVGVAALAFPASDDPHARKIAENTIKFEKWARAFAANTNS